MAGWSADTKSVRTLRWTVLVSVAGAWACVGARIGPSVSGVVDRTSGADELRLTYLGVGGWIMEHGDDMILAAPLYSNPGFFRTGIAPIHADTVEIDRQMSRYDVRCARAIL